MALLRDPAAVAAQGAAERKAAAERAAAETAAAERAAAERAAAEGAAAEAAAERAAAERAAAERAAAERAGGGAGRRRSGRRRSGRRRRRRRRRGRRRKGRRRRPMLAEALAAVEAAEAAGAGGGGAGRAAERAGGGTGRRRQPTSTRQPVLEQLQVLQLAPSPPAAVVSCLVERRTITGSLQKQFLVRWVGEAQSDSWHDVDTFIWRPEILEALSRREGFARLEDDPWYPRRPAYHRGYDIDHPQPEGCSGTAPTRHVSRLIGFVGFQEASVVGISPKRRVRLRFWSALSAVAGDESANVMHRRSVCRVPSLLTPALIHGAPRKLVAYQIERINLL